MIEFDFSFFAGFILGMLSCIGVIATLVFYACVVAGARADQLLERMREVE